MMTLQENETPNVTCSSLMYYSDMSILCTLIQIIAFRKIKTMMINNFQQKKQVTLI